MPDLPSGTVTFLFTDIEGSTALWERDRAAMQAAVERHLTLLQTTIEAHGGVLFKIVGDSVQAAFRTAPQALAAALAAQRALLAEDWGEIGELRVRTALHAGEAEPDQRGDYLAAPLNRLSRLLSAGHGGQILLTQTVQQLSRSALPPDAELRDLGEHHLRDLLEPERIFQLLHPELQDAFPAPRTLETRPHNLPIQLTPLLGRDEEVADVHDIVTKQGARLVTLTGPGGTGKTRLALAVAAQLLGDFPDGAWFVDLAPLNDPGLVLPTIARTLGLREGNNLSLNDVVSVYLATKRLLVVLDNYEHLLTAAPVVNDLLRAGPDTVVLVTSREPLHVRGEREVAVGPLALPDHHHHAPVDIVQNPAVALFVERAQAARRDFELTDENASLVAAICRQLDGLPLAIELAAARVKVLPPGALLARLKSRLPLLAGGPRDAPARQRALRDTIAWSYDLLRAEEQALFGRLAVFVGGFTLEAAEVMAAGAPDLGIDSFEGVASLMDKSLLRSVDGLSGEPRYTMLETVREYGLERLEASGEGGEIRRRHAAYFLSMTESAHPQQLETGEAGWSERLAAERDNLRAALRWTAEHGVEGVGPEGISEPERIIAVYQRAGQMARRLYANTDALVLFRRALSLLEATPVVAPTGDSLAADLREGMADVLELTGQRDAAVTAYREASIALGNGDPVWRARLHRKLGETLQAQRRHDEAAAVFAQAEEILGLEATAPSAAWSQEWLQVQLGRMWLYYFQSDTAALARLVERVAPAVTRHGTAAQRASFFHCQTLLSFRQDRYTGSEKTMAHAQAAVAASEESGDESQLAVSRFLVGFALWQRRSPEAETHLADALVLAERIGDLTQQARCLAYLTAAIRQRGDEEGARALNDRFLAVAQVGQIKEYVAIAKANRAWLAWRKENSPLVEAEARAALALWDEVPIAFPFRWLALWPLLGALLAEQRLAEGLEVARTLLAPDLQPLPDPLAAALKAAIRAADHGNEVAGEHLREATALAESMAYL